ncbi:DUF2617 family protein [Glycomyces sp. L485]|uniref:DUF2617 family protein n=1 Tax=Glycomyces sp. L485 TaxID=2909235 RepID=UPI001F4A6942|nr:DUF2617 family protein [Glycomyces sp. L485]MCH7231942.1 DUF2617 family protein [Glycomyces sp. L485]
MITSLEVPYVDVSAGSLTFRPDAPSMPVLDQLDRDAGPLRLSLRLLGASHQAVVATPDGLIAETLAYRDGLVPDLPEQFSQRVGNWRHRYTCGVEHVTVPQLRERVRGFRARGEEDLLLVGVFGSEPDAVTALEITGTEPLTWRTVHTYPQHGEVVTTTGTVVTVG